MTAGEWYVVFRCPACQTVYADEHAAYACVVSHPEAWGRKEDPFLYPVAETTQP